MRVLVALEQRFVSHNGDLYVNAVSHYGFWQRYLDVFDNVTIIARVKDVDQVPAGWPRATGERVDYLPMPYFQGFYDFLRHIPPLVAAASRASGEEGAFILRVPGTIGTLIWLALLCRRKSFALEVVGDPYDSLSPLVWRTVAIWPIRLLAALFLKQQCRMATRGIAFVTRERLQKRYPPPEDVRSYPLPTGIKVYGISDVEVPIDWADTGQESRRSGGLHRLIFVGTLAALYKGQDVLLRAVAECTRRGMSLELRIIGDGCSRAYLERLASKLGISEIVQFIGHISDPKQVFANLRSADLFVLPSIQEGLPRAMVEAMACGLPCVGSTVGGIPELLASEDLVPPGDSRALAAKLEQVLSDPKRMARMSERNLSISREYRTEVLKAKRIEFYHQVSSAVQDQSSKTLSAVGQIRGSHESIHQEDSAA